MEQIVTSLIPTVNLEKFEEILQGYLGIENIKIVLGSGLQSNFNPQSMLEEIKDTVVEIESMLFKRENFSFLFTINIKNVKKINEIGLFCPDEGQDILIAYRSDKDLLKFSSEARITLELVLPYSRWNKEIDTSPAINFSSDLYTEIPDDIEDLSDFFSDIVEPQHSLVNEKLNFSWAEVIKKEMPFAQELSLIAFDRHPTKSTLLFLYKKKKGKEFFFNTYNVSKQEFKKPLLVMTVRQETSERYGIFGKVDNNYIRCYQSHANGVFCIGLSLSKNKAQRSYVKQQYHAAHVKDNTTLFKLGSNAALGGGDYTGFFWEKWNAGNGLSASGILNEAWQCLVPTRIIDIGTDNPLIDYIPDDEDDEEKGKIEIIGGHREPEIIEEEITEEITAETKEEIIKETKEEIKKIEESKEEITKEEIKDKVKEIVTEKITEKVTQEIRKEILEEIIEEIVEEITIQIKKKEIIEEEIIEEEIVEKITMTQHAPKLKTPNFIIIQNKGVEKKIKIKKSPIQTISVKKAPIQKENFTYFSTLQPTYIPPETYKFETTADFNDLAGVSALTHMLCRITNKTYIFSRKIFKDENEAKFFVYNRSNKSINTYFLPAEMRELVTKSNMTHYTDVHVVAYNTLIYFALHLYSKTKNKISTQIIKLEVTS